MHRDAAAEPARWRVLTKDIRELDGHDYRGVDLVAGGVPCSPFSVAGKQLGADDERDLFPEALRIIREARPTMVMLENTSALASARFDGLQSERAARARAARLRARVEGAQRECVRCSAAAAAVRARRGAAPLLHGWQWPPTSYRTPPTVGDALEDLMAARGWPGAHRWARDGQRGWRRRSSVGRKKHGGPDLGPTRARQAWSLLGVDGRSVADEAPGPEAPSTTGRS